MNELVKPSTKFVASRPTKDGAVSNRRLGGALTI
jgi:hypothetical protein